MSKKIKISSRIPSHWGRIISFGTFGDIKFGVLGDVDIEEDKANKLLETYPELLSLVDIEPKHVKTTKVVDTELVEENIELKKEIEILKSQKDLAEMNSTDWKGKYEELEKEFNKLTELHTNTKAVSDQKVLELETRIQLASKKLEELREIAVKMNLTEDKTKDLKKDQLIELIIEESKK